MADWTLPESPEDDPILGDEGYPHDIELQRIRDWPVNAKLDELLKLMDYVRARWSYPEYWKEADIEEYGRPQREYTISTVGWSGNESLIGVLEENTWFNIIAPYSWQRGGHYVYRIPLERNDANQGQA